MTTDNIANFLGADQPIIRVRLSDVRGSSPRETGTEMFVAKSGILGTIGGGRLEYMAIEAARELLLAGDLAIELDIPLGPEIGQCCGGRVSVALARMSDADRRNALERADREVQTRPIIYVMGGGHVGRALADIFQHLPFHTVVVDQRDDELSQCGAAVEIRLSAIPEVNIATAPAGSAFIVLTHDHALDFLLVAAALERGDAAYVGLIGSATKRAKFENWFRQHCEAKNLAALVCPIGKSESRDKRPEIIAAFVVAEVVAALSQNHATQMPHHPIAEPTYGPKDGPIPRQKFTFQSGGTGT